jgi:hypothetical protein
MPKILYIKALDDSFCVLGLKHPLFDVLCCYGKIFQVLNDTLLPVILKMPL